MILAAMIAGAAAEARAAPAPDDEAIVIQGTRPSEHQVRDFIRALTSVPSFGQIGRFHDAVCPVAMGLPQSQNEQIAQRMRQVAAVAKIKVAPAKCTPNAFVERIGYAMERPYPDNRKQYCGGYADLLGALDVF